MNVLLLPSARDKNGKSFPVEWRHVSSKAKISIDVGHEQEGPDMPHIGWQFGKPKVVGHILLDDVPINRA